MRLRRPGGDVPAILVMVGASVVGGIHVRGVARLHRAGAIAVGREVGKADELGHFTFGSTVVVLLPRGATEPHVRPDVRLGEDIPMGRALFEAPS